MSDVTEKIRKLLAMARDKGASENEQTQALIFAQRLMLKHGIHHIDEKTGGADWGEYIKELDKKHHRVIAMAVGKLYGTHPVFSPDKSFRFAGREETRYASNMTVNFIADQLDMAYKEQLPKGMTQAERSVWRREFKISCAYRISSRVDDMVKELTTDDKLAKAELDCTALVVLNHFEQLEAECDDFLKGKTSPLRSMTTRYKNSEAMNAGRSAGNNVRINQGIKESMPKQIAGSSS